MSAYQSPGPLFDICANRHKGNEESVKANAKPDKHRQRALIMSILEREGYTGRMTCDAIEEITGLPHQSCSARISELKRDGLIHKIGTRPTRSGCQAAVYAKSKPE